MCSGVWSPQGSNPQVDDLRSEGTARLCLITSRLQVRRHGKQGCGHDQTPAAGSSCHEFAGKQPKQWRAEQGSFQVEARQQPAHPAQTYSVLTLPASWYTLCRTVEDIDHGQAVADKQHAQMMSVKPRQQTQMEYATSPTKPLPPSHTSLPAHTQTSKHRGYHCSAQASHSRCLWRPDCSGASDNKAQECVRNVSLPHCGASEVIKHLLTAHIPNA